MDAVREGANSYEQMNEINVCRLWLQVHFISDIVTVDGAKLHPGYIEGRRVRESEWNWPR